jgi:hypothetical protein
MCQFDTLVDVLMEKSNEDAEKCAIQRAIQAVLATYIRAYPGVLQDSPQSEFRTLNSQIMDFVLIKEGRHTNSLR